jgi:hypothetical protein
MSHPARPRLANPQPADSRKARHLRLVPPPPGRDPDPVQVRARLGPVRALAPAPQHPRAAQPASPRGSAA